MMHIRQHLTVNGGEAQGGEPYDGSASRNVSRP